MAELLVLTLVIVVIILACKARVTINIEPRKPKCPLGGRCTKNLQTCKAELVKN
ncbi:MAG: hypothetical protein FWG79_06905 [Bacteroidales bacterium]|nr:hypothetical protein [Bacteroidales bacterium]